MRLDRRTLRSRLEEMGSAPAPPPSPGFVTRTEERLRSLRHVVAVEGPRARAAVPRRPRLVLAAVAAAVVLAAVLVLPGGDERVSLTTDGGPTTTPPTTASPPPPTAVEPAPTTTAPPPSTLPPPTAAPSTAAPVRPRPTTTTTAVTTTTAAPVTTTTPPVPETTTTTKPPPPARLELRCEAGAEAGAPAVTCAWSGVGDASFAGWRLHRAVGTSAKQVVWTSGDPSTLAHVDLDVAPATAYSYLVEAVAADGRTLAKGGVATVECCPAAPA